MFGDKKSKTQADDTQVEKTGSGTPTVGRDVHFLLEGRDGQPVARPAKVVHVNEGGTLNLQVFTDGENDGLGNVVHRTSVAEGSGVGNWAWPTKK